MKQSSWLVLFFVFGTGILKSDSSLACYANFVHTNACAGDTIWFYGLDVTAVHVWDFGDSAVANPNLAFDDTAYHVYTTAGTYYVSHFVNIGAEWAFETQEITVGTDCFGAGFDTRCSGSLGFQFLNQSSGNHLSYAWNFGDPASGANDTSSAFNPYHQFSATGNFNVTLVISDGTASDSIVQVVVADSSCMTSFISYLWNPCAGDTTHFYYNFNGVNAVYWDFGDPASGINNYSTLLAPAHIFAAPGIYIGQVIFSNGILTDTLPVVTNVIDCNVWPGDANRDGYVTAEDFFAIGLYFGDTGVVRNNATTNFAPQPAANWVNNTTLLGYMYLQDLVDKKHADCNGDGVVNEDDAAVIIQNFGMSHLQHNILSSSMPANPSSPHLALSLPALVSNSDTITAGLQYGDAAVHTPIYGICAYIDYDPVQVEATSISVDFSNSMLDTLSSSNLLTFCYNDLVNNRVVLVVTRKNQTGIDHYGMVAQLHFTTAPGYTGNLELRLGADSKVMTNSVFPGGTYGTVMNILKVYLDDAATQVVLGIRDPEVRGAVSVYPIPSRGYIHLVVAKSAAPYQVRILDAAGRILMEEYPVSNRQLIDVKNLATGIYFLEAQGDQWVSTTKLIISR